MAFCGNCGATLSDDTRFCAKCGQPVQSAAPGAPPTPPPAYQSAGTPAATSTGMTRNVAGGLCYVFGFITGIVFLVLEPYNRDPFVRFHAFQSIFFSIAAIVASTVIGMVPFIGILLWFPVWLAVMALWVVLLVQAFSDKKWKLPIIGDLAEKQV